MLTRELSESVRHLWLEINHIAIPGNTDKMKSILATRKLSLTLVRAIVLD